MAITIIIEDGVALRTANVTLANAQTHIAANDRLADEAQILLAIANDERDDMPVAWKYCDETEDARLIYDRSEALEIAAIDPSLIEWIEVPAPSKQLSVSEIKAEIESQLSPEALDWFTNHTAANEFIVQAQRDGIDEAVQEIEACAARPAPYRWDGSALYRWSDDSDAYIHCFQSIYVTDMDEAIRLYEARKAAAE